MTREPELTDWIGRSETSTDRITLAPALAAAATLDDTTTRLAEGAPLPPLWHWFYFLTKASRSALGADGHPAKGGFMPPVPLPRRMFAGAKLAFQRPLILGEMAEREARIISVSGKSGRTGRLVFVQVATSFRQGGQVCIEETQDIVYREPGEPVPAPEPAALPAVPQGAWAETLVADPVLLFRFSALTFNAHRIHYDLPYATGVEGYPGLVVQGPLTALLLIELVRRHAARPVARFAFRGEAPLFSGAPIRLAGVAEAERISLSATRIDGRTAMSATAELG